MYGMYRKNEEVKFNRSSENDLLKVLRFKKNKNFWTFLMAFFMKQTKISGHF